MIEVMIGRSGHCWIFQMRKKYVVPPSGRSRPGRWLMPWSMFSLLLLVGCSASDMAPPPADSNPASSPSGAASRLAVTNCQGARALFGDALDGLTLITDIQQDSKAALQCIWRDDADAVPMRMRHLMLQVYVDGISKDDMADAQTIGLMNMRSLPAPMIEKHGGVAFGNRGTDGQGSAGQVHVQLPDAQVIVQFGHGAEASGVEVSDSVVIQAAAGLLDLH